MASPDYSLRVIPAHANARYSFATHDTIEDMLRFLTTETESRIHTHEVTMIPNESRPKVDTAPRNISGLAQAAKDKTGALIAGANDVTQDMMIQAVEHVHKAEEKTAAVIEKVGDVAKDVATKTGEQVEKIGDKVVDAGKRLLKLV